MNAHRAPGGAACSPRSEVWFVSALVPALLVSALVLRLVSAPPPPFRDRHASAARPLRARILGPVSARHDIEARTLGVFSFRRYPSGLQRLTKIAAVCADDLRRFLEPVLGEFLRAASACNAHIGWPIPCFHMSLFLAYLSLALMSTDTGISVLNAQEV